VVGHFVDIGGIVERFLFYEHMRNTTDMGSCPHINFKCSGFQTTFSWLVYVGASSVDNFYSLNITEQLLMVTKIPITYYEKKVKMVMVNISQT
jgi:hypothetical protein